MDYGVKYSGSGTSIDGSTYTAEILKNGYSGDVTTIKLGKPAIVPRWGQQGDDVYEPILPSSVEILVFDKAKALQAEIFNADEEMFRLRIKQGSNVYWLGKIVTDGFEDSLDLAPESTKIVAIDGLGQLEGIGFEEIGRVSIVQCAADILKQLGLDLHIRFASNWFTPDILASEDPLYKIYTDRLAQRGDNEEVLNTIDVFREYLSRFGLQLYQDSGIWWVIQRELLKETNYHYFEYDKDGVYVADDTETPAVTIVEGDQYGKRLKGGRKPFKKAFKTTTCRYVPKKSSGTIIQNGSFEEWSGDLPDGWSATEDLGVVSKSEDSSDGYQSASIIARYNLDPNALPTDYLSRTMDLVGDGVGRLHIRVSAHAVKNPNRPSGPTSNSPRKAYLKVLFNGYYLYRASDGTLSWEEIGVGDPDDEYILLHNAGCSAIYLQWQEDLLMTPAVPAGSGDLEIRLYPLVEFEFTPGQEQTTAGFTAILYDNVVIMPISASVGREAISASTVLPNTVNRDASQFQIGDGPTTLTPSALTIGVSVTLTGDWKRGPYATEPPSGKTLDEMSTETWLRAQKQPLEIHRATYTARAGGVGAVLEPHNVLVIGTRRFAFTYLERDLIAAHSSGEWVEIRADDSDIATVVVPVTEDSQNTGKYVTKGNVLVQFSLSTNSVIVERDSFKSLNWDGAVDGVGHIITPGTQGWAITGKGEGEFSDVTVRGTFETGVGPKRIEIRSSDNELEFFEDDLSIVRIGSDVFQGKAGIEIANGIVSVDTTSAAVGASNIAVYGKAHGSSEGAAHVGVYGSSDATSGLSYGLYGIVTGAAPTNYGACVSASAGTTNYGIRASASGGTTNYGIRASASGGTTNWAGYFEQAVYVGGNLTVSGLIQSNVTAGSYGLKVAATDQARLRVMPQAAATGVTVDVTNAAEDTYEPLTFNAYSYNFGTGAATFTHNVLVGLGLYLGSNNTIYSSGNVVYLRSSTAAGIADLTTTVATFAGGITTTAGNIGSGTSLNLYVTGATYPSIALGINGSITFKNYVSGASLFSIADVSTAAATFAGNLTVSGAGTNKFAGTSLFGTLTSTGGKVEIECATEQLRLQADVSNFTSLTQVGSGGSVTVAGTGDWIWNMAGKDIYPYANYDQNLGTISNKFLTLYAAELRVETLVSEDHIVTTGGRWTVGWSTFLIADINDSQTTIDVKHNNLSSGDRIYFEADGNVEFMAVTDGGTPITGGYRYTVTRNLDGSGGNAWYAGSACLNTKQTGGGFIDAYATRGIKAATEYGPTIVGNVRNSATYNDWSPRWAVGNLNGLYGYSSNTYGAAFGVPSGAWVKIDPTYGVRLGYDTAAYITLNSSGLSISGSQTSGDIAGMVITASALTATAGGNTTIVSSGTTAFACGPTGAPTVTITRAGILTAVGGVFTGTVTATTLTLSGANGFGYMTADGGLRFVNTDSPPTETNIKPTGLQGLYGNPPTTTWTITTQGGAAAFGSVSVSGNGVWHAGNFTPGNYSLTSHVHTGVYLPVAGAGDIYTHNASEFAAASHTHAASAIVSGQLAAVRGGTGQDSGAWEGTIVITAGNWACSAALPVAKGGTGSQTASGARTNLELGSMALEAIGIDGTINFASPPTSMTFTHGKLTNITV